MAFSFFDRRSGKSVRVIMKDAKKGGDRSAAIDRILNAPREEVFDIMPPRYPIPDKARMFDSMKCDECGEYCREDKIRMVQGKQYCSDCYIEYDR